MSKNKGNPTRLNVAEQRALQERAQLQAQQQQAYQHQQQQQQAAQALEIRLRVAQWSTTIIAGSNQSVHDEDIDDATIDRAVDISLRTLDSVDRAFDRRRLAVTASDGLKTEVKALSDRLETVSAEIRAREAREAMRPVVPLDPPAAPAPAAEPEPVENLAVERADF